MDTNLATIVVAAIGAVSSIITVIISNHHRVDSNKNHKEQLKVDKKTQTEVKNLTKKVDTIDAQLQANNLQTARIDLRQAFEHSPDDIPAILELSRIYFINLKGNADLGRKFLAWVKEYHVKEWAQKHHEDIANLIKAATHSR